MRLEWIFGVLTLLSAAIRADAQIPPGYELVDIASGPGYYSWTRINNCGELVYAKGFYYEPQSDIYLYDNGRLRSISDSGVPDGFPDINDDGVIVWTRAVVMLSGTIVKWDAGDQAILGTGLTSSINAFGNVAWELITDASNSCAFEVEVHYFDGNDVHVIIADERSNQSVRLNDRGNMVWTSYNFCVSPWQSEIRGFIGGEYVTFPTTLPGMNPQAPWINNNDTVAWSRNNGIEVWSNGVTTLLTDFGSHPSLNDSGDIYFIRFYTQIGAWQSWLYRDGEFYRLVNDTNWHTDGDINNWGECVWHWCCNPNQGCFFDPCGIIMMRRIRNGDFDNDGDIELNDFAPWPACLTGPEPRDRLCDCRFFDMRHDRTVDLRDLAAFQNTYANPHNPAEGCCVPHDTSGCGDSDVAACVCAALPTCCSAAWTDPCVLLVELLGCGECP